MARAGIPSSFREPSSIRSSIRWSRSESSNQGTQWRKSCYALAEDFVHARNTLSWMESAGDTVYGPQSTHPHPSWSNGETMVAFASDRTGVTQVYVVDVG